MIDVFICTYNPNAVYLERTIQSILNQDLDNNLWNLTVIDNNSTNPVNSIEFISKNKINVIVETNQGLTAARKCANENSTAEILVFVDDDNILRSDYLSSVLRIFDNNDIGIVSGKIVPEYEANVPNWFQDFEPMLAIRNFPQEFFFSEVNSPKFNNLFPIGAGMAIKKVVIHAYYESILSGSNYIDGRKGDELLSSEDVDLDYFALSKNYKIGVSSLLFLKHIIPQKRTTKEYIIKLAEGNLISTQKVNKKWSNYFGTNLFDYFDQSDLKIYLKMVIYYFLSSIDRYYIKYRILKSLKTIKALT